MTNDELLAALRVELGWLRNELVRQSEALEESQRKMADLQRTIANAPAFSS